MRVGLPPAIVLGLRSEVSYIVTLVAPTADHEGTSCPHIVFIGSGGTSAWGMTLNATGRATDHELKNESKTDRAKPTSSRPTKKYLKTSSKARSPPEAAPEPGRALVIPCVQQASITRAGPPTSGGEPRPSVIVPSAAEGVPDSSQQL